MSDYVTFWMDFFQGNGTYVIDTQRIIVFCCWILFVLTVYSFLMKKDNDPKKLLKCVPRWPLLGNVELFRDIKRFADVLKSFADTYGKYVEFYVLNNRNILISDPVIIKEIMMKRPNHFRRAQNFEHSVAGFDSVANSLFFVEGKVWGRHRRLTAPSFSHRNVSGMGCVINAKLDELVARTQTLAKQEQIVQMDEHAFGFTISIISAVAFGGLNGQLEKYFCSQQLSNDVKDIFSTIMERTVFPLPDFAWTLWSLVVGEQKGFTADRRFSEHCLQVIKEKKANRANSSQKTNSEKSLDSEDILTMAERPCLIDTLMRATSLEDSTRLTDAEILGNVKTFFIAGSDTTSVVITWAMYEFCVNPELLKQVQEEVDRVMQGSTDYATAVMERKLPLCAACFVETMRLRGPGPFLIFNTTGTTPVTLSNGIVVNPGDDVNCFFDAIHRDPETFVDPCTFNAARWINQTPSDPTEQQRIQHLEKEMLGFGFGPRICPGMQLAHTEGVACIAAMARHFNMKLACDPSSVTRDQNFVSKANQMPILFTNRS